MLARSEYTQPRLITFFYTVLKIIEILDEAEEQFPFSRNEVHLERVQLMPNEFE